MSTASVPSSAPDNRGVCDLCDGNMSVNGHIREILDQHDPKTKDGIEFIRENHPRIVEMMSITFERRTDIVRAWLKGTLLPAPDSLESIGVNLFN